MQKEIVHNTCCTQNGPHYSMHKRVVRIWQWPIWNQTKKILPQITTQRTKENEEKNLLINRSTKSMRREVPTPLSNEKVTYTEIQGDLWVTLTFGFSHSQSVPWNFSSLNYINKENKSLFIFSQFFKLHKILKLIITIFTKLFYNIVQFILLYFGNICSRPHVELKYFAPGSWRYVLYSHQGKDCIV